MSTAAGSSAIRGYTKIEGAARALNFDFRDKTVLDIGSSTGGFTEYALKHGAKRVIAVEKGSHQMKAPLRFDPRIELHEKTDIFDVVAAGSTRTELRRAFATTGANDEASPVTTGASEEAMRSPVLMLPTAPDIILADVSFISLTKVLMYAKMNLARHGTQFFVMLKPQFEAHPSELTRGVVKNEKYRRDIIKRFELWLKQNGFIIVGKRDNQLQGKHGNLERFYHLRLAK